MEQEQQQHWQNAQRLELGLDLIAAARSQLRLLAAVDSHPVNLYRGPTLDRAILRYENCWLPLLAEHGPSTSTGLPLIPPLDCAWIWHCHRLNPVQYIRDCKASYGKLLDAPNVPTGIESEAVAHTRQLWDLQFSDEKYEVALEDFLCKNSVCSRKITYDLQAAVERQSSFFYQVSRPHMEEENFLNAALQRYKGFLYLLKLSSLQLFLVPTYDIDLMWHSHQASPSVYQEDTVKLLGRVLNHDDTDSDRTEGQKLDTGFHRTRNIWQHTFGSLYEKAGSMYRGEAPALLPLLECTQHPMYSPKPISTMSTCKGVQGVEPRKSMQVFITVQKARNLHVSQDGIVGVRLLFKKKCRMLKLETSWIKGTHNPEWHDVWSLECEEGTEGLRLELRFQDVKCCSLIKKSGLIGWTDISWQTVTSSSTLSHDGWVPLTMKSHLGSDQKPTSLRVSVSITPPTAVPFLLRMEHPFLRDGGRNYLSKIVYDHQNRKTFMVKVNGLGAGEILLIQVYSIGHKGSPGILLGSATCVGPARTTWSLLDGDMHVVITSTEHDCKPDIQLTSASNDSVTLLHGRKCQYEVSGSRQDDEAGYITLVRQLQGTRVGKATGLFNWKSGAMEISTEENGVLVVLLCTIMTVAVDNIQLTSFCNRSSLQKLKRVNRTDEWGAVILNEYGYFQTRRLLRFCPWYSMSSHQWLSMFYCTGLRCDDNWGHSVCKLSSYFGLCGGSCGGCSAGICENSLKGSANGGQGGGCGGCGSGGCMNGLQIGGILPSGDDGSNKQKHATTTTKHGRGGGCGGCGSGGCMNGLHIGGILPSGDDGSNKQKHATTTTTTKHGRGGGCGGCGAGGCGGCSVGSNGNSTSGAYRKGVQGGKCGGCGAGGCGNGIMDFDSDRKGVQGGKSGGYVSGGFGNSTGKVPELVQGSGCGGCGAGGCGNSTETRVTTT